MKALIKHIVLNSPLFWAAVILSMVAGGYVHLYPDAPWHQLLLPFIQAFHRLVQYI